MMEEHISEPVSVVWLYNARSRRVSLCRLQWQNRDYKLGQVDEWHATRHDGTLIHHFSLSDADSQVYFKLALNTNDLHWTIENYVPASELATTYRRYEA